MFAPPNSKPPSASKRPSSTSRTRRGTTSNSASSSRNNTPTKRRNANENRPQSSIPASRRRPSSNLKQRNAAAAGSTSRADGNDSADRKRPHSSIPGSRRTVRSTSSTTVAKNNTTSATRRSPSTGRVPLRRNSSNTSLDGTSAKRRNTSTGLHGSRYPSDKAPSSSSQEKQQNPRSTTSSTPKRRRNNFMGDSEEKNTASSTLQDTKLQRRTSVSTPVSQRTASRTNSTPSGSRSASKRRSSTQRSRPSSNSTSDRTLRRTRKRSAEKQQMTAQRKKSKEQNTPSRKNSVSSRSSSGDIPLDSAPSDTITDTIQDPSTDNLSTDDQNGSPSTELASSGEQDDSSPAAEEEEVFQTVYDPDHPTRITARLISERCLSKEELETLSRDEITDRVLQLERINLENCNIFEIDNLECFNHITHLYLQHNHIKELTDQFIFLPELLFVALFDNHIEKVENLQALDKLQFLDISQNSIVHFDVAEIPRSVQYLNIANNPFCNDPESYDFYRQRLIKALPKLVLLDKVVVTREERQDLGAPMDETLYAENGLVDRLVLQMPTNELKQWERSQWNKSNTYQKAEEKLNDVRFDRSASSSTQMASGNSSKANLKRSAAFSGAKNEKLYENLRKTQTRFGNERKKHLMSLLNETQGRIESRRTKMTQQQEQAKSQLQELKLKFQQEMQELKEKTEAAMAKSRRNKKMKRSEATAAASDTEDVKDV